MIALSTPYSVPSRRDVVMGIGATATASVCISCEAAAQSGRRYCADSSGGSDTAASVRVDRFEDRVLRTYLMHEHEEMRLFFERRGEIYVIPGSNDAYMHGDEIYLGELRLKEHGNKDYGLLQITGMLAHEKGHTFQVHWGINKMLEDVRGHPVKYVELHADFLAGSYMAWRAKKRKVEPSKLAELFFELGDARFRSEQHHGTRGERYLAFANGYRQFRAAQSSADVRDAASMGLLYVRKIV